MNEAQRLAFFCAQLAIFNAEVARMQAENTYRDAIQPGNILYGDEEFQALIDEYSILGHNGAIEFLTGGGSHAEAE